MTSETPDNLQYRWFRDSLDKMNKWPKNSSLSPRIRKTSDIVHTKQSLWLHYKRSLLCIHDTWKLGETFIQHKNSIKYKRCTKLHSNSLPYYTVSTVHFSYWTGTIKVHRFQMRIHSNFLNGQELINILTNTHTHTQTNKCTKTAFL